MSRKELEGIIKKLLGIEYELDDRTSLIKYGGDSLFFGRLQIELKRTFGLKVPIQQLFQNGTIEQLCKVLGIEEHNGEKIDITDLQTAYLYGRKPEMILGGKGSRAYFSFEVEDVDIARLQKAIKNLVEEQEALRCTFHEDQYANVQESQAIDFTYYDLQILSSKEKDEKLEEIRKDLFERNFNINKGPLICFVATRIDDKKTIVHICHDGLVADGESHQIILKELENLYYGKQNASHCSFSEYTHYIKDMKENPEYSELLNEKVKRLSEFDTKPQLDALKDAKEVMKPNVGVVARIIPEDLYFKICEKGRENAVTPFSILLTAFGKALAKYSDNSKFLLNLPVSYRPMELEGVENLVGLCSNFILFGFDDSYSIGFLEQTENVLHNAKNIHYVLENLKKLLKPNGTIIILEETLEAYTLLTSMEFKDGLTGFTDERAENNQTFFKREQWEGVFKEHKADIVYQFPEKGTPLEMAGQTIYVVRFKENYICPDKNNMLDELERRIPEYMIPSVITFLPRLPQTSNDKIDRGRISKWISASAEENKKVDVAELPQNDLEEQIARIWCKELNIERIGRNDNFYLSGGDSLLIAQVIARMRETIEAAKRWSWDDLLKEMMKTPTIRGVAKILSNQAGENEQDKSLVIIKEAAESSEKKVTVVFHAGTGTLTPYNSLIAYITERSQENEAVMGFTFGDEAEYLAIPTDKIFENLGKKYGRILSELGFTEYTLIGHCVGGLIALETAHYLKDKGKNVSSVTLLSTSIPHKKEETVLADLDMKIFETAVQTSLYNELLLERTFASLIDADIKKAGHQVDNDTLQQVIEYLIFNNGGNITVQALCSLTGKFAEVGAEFQRLHSMSATERMNDLYTTIERPNGQLMEHQRKMLNVLFRVFAQNFRCVSSYIPKVYTGKMRVFDCESVIANFFPSLFSEDKKTWEQYAQGEFLFDTMKGDHISCMNSPYIEENVKKILDL